MCGWNNCHKVNKHRNWPIRIARVMKIEKMKNFPGVTPHGLELFPLCSGPTGASPYCLVKDGWAWEWFSDPLRIFDDDLEHGFHLDNVLDQPFLSLGWGGRERLVIRSKMVTSGFCLLLLPLARFSFFLSLASCFSKLNSKKTPSSLSTHDMPLIGLLTTHPRTK